MKGETFFDNVKMPYKLSFSVHVVSQMFNRSIGESDVKSVILRGVIIEEYPDDTPYPSYLILDMVHDRPLHVLAAYDKEDGVVIVVTAYEPAPELWDETLTRKRDYEVRGM